MSDFDPALALLMALHRGQVPPDDAMAQNIERQRIPGMPNLQPPFGLDVLGRRLVEARPRDATTSELLGTAMFGDKQASPYVGELARTPAVNSLMRFLPQAIDAGPKIAKATYDQTVTEPAAALLEATKDPSIANLTNAGVKTALGLAPLSPRAALTGMATSSGLGLTTAGLMDASKALAPAPAEAADADPIAQIDKRLADIRTRLGQKLTGGERRTLEAEANQLSQTKSAIFTKSAVTGIESDAARKNEIETRQNKARDIFNTSMQDYEESQKPGQLMQTINKLGVLAPAAAAATGGAITRMASPNAGLVRQYLSGLVPALSVANAQPVNALLNEPVANPERTAYQKATRSLADTDPLKAIYEAKARDLPLTNPVRDAANKDLSDPANLMRRGTLAAVEATSAFPGYDLMSGLARLRKAPAEAARMIGELPGTRLEANNAAMNKARAVASEIPDLPPQHRDALIQARIATTDIRDAGGRFVSSAEKQRIAEQQLVEERMLRPMPLPSAPNPLAPTSNTLQNLALRWGLPAAVAGGAYAFGKYGQ